MDYMKKILLMTPGYYTKDISIDASPVVNFFAREWKNLGYDVRVIHLHASFPLIMRLCAKPFLQALESRLGVTICCDTVLERDYIDEIVPVYRIPVRKVVPHTRYSKSVINKTTQKILDYCHRYDFTPDVIISHFVNPCVEIMLNLKKIYNVPIVDVLHSNGQEFFKLYGENGRKMIESIDVFGYRCNAIHDNFEKQYGERPRWFYCYSGIPQKYIQQSDPYREFVMKNRFIFVGNFRPRKYADVVVEGVAKSYPRKNFVVKFVGEGAGKQQIIEKAKQYDLNSSNVQLLGHISRDEVRSHMLDSDIFVLISRNEVFGLVYLEAMSTGCIPIASKKEGFDGIIRDGYNGFLCNAGDSEELCHIINRIKQMPAGMLQEISNNAIDTAKKMTDQAVAKDYIETVFRLIL